MKQLLIGNGSQYNRVREFPVKQAHTGMPAAHIGKQAGRDPGIFERPLVGGQGQIIAVAVL